MKLNEGAMDSCDAEAAQTRAEKLPVEKVRAGKEGKKGNGGGAGGESGERRGEWRSERMQESAAVAYCCQSATVTVHSR